VSNRLTAIIASPDAAAQEPRDRVSTALVNSGFKFPLCRPTNLVPGGREEGRAES
jgi:predicted ATPase with chaperone activity